MSYENNTPAVPEVNGTPILIFGIISLVLGWVPGIILAIIGNKKAKEITDQGIELTGTAKIGSILCKIGFWVGIVTTAIYVLSFFSGILMGIIGAIAGY